MAITQVRDKDGSDQGESSGSGEVGLQIFSQDKISCLTESGEGEKEGSP